MSVSGKEQAGWASVTLEGKLKELLGVHLMVTARDKSCRGSNPYGLPLCRILPEAKIAALQRSTFRLFCQTAVDKALVQLSPSTQ